MSKVILYEIKTFDVNDGYNFTFDYKGADNVDGNILRIYKSYDTKTPIIIQKQNSTKLNSLLKSTANIYGLTNGEKYSATISMTDGETELKETCSVPVVFYCFQTPSLSFKNTEMFKQPVNSSSFIAELKYDYDKKGSYVDKLNEYKVLVYPYADDVNQLELYETKRAYVNDTENIKAYITDLDGGKSYYLKAVGTTVHGVSVESILLKVDIADNTQYLKSAFNAKVQNETASIYLTSHLLNIDGKSTGTIYFENGKVIINENSTVYFDKDVSVYNTAVTSYAKCQNNSFLLSIKFSKFPIDSDILILKDKDNKGIITLRAISNKIHSIDNKTIRDTKGYLRLKAVDKISENTIFTENMNLNFADNNDICMVEMLVIIERVNGGYNLKAKIVE